MQKPTSKSFSETPAGTKEQKAKTQANQQGYWDMMINGIVRPPRAKYNNAQLGNKVFSYKDKIYMREDIKVTHLGKELELTIYISSAQKEFSHQYVILYMHGNSSCRLQALGLIKTIPNGVSLASFDFMGCGKNQQSETISLGYRQAEQAKTVAQYLRNHNFKVILWGRSMGAATALLYGKAQFIVADSSFKSFKSLCKQVAKQHSPQVIPNFMVNCFFPCVFMKIKKDVDKKANYDVEDLDVRQAVKKLSQDTTIVFMSGNRDVLINKRNSQKLFDACPCQNKYLKLFDGDHNSKRPQQTLNQVMQLILKHIKSRQPIKGVSADSIFLKMGS